MCQTISALKFLFKTYLFLASVPLITNTNYSAPVDVFKDGKHHFIFILWCCLVFRMTTRVNYPVHVQVQVVEFYIVRIWLGSVNWNFHSIDIFSLIQNTRIHQCITTRHYHLLLHAVNYYGRIFLRQPPKKSGNSHFPAKTELGSKVSG